MRRRALFVVSTRGQGHIVRCRALAAELATRGWASTMTNKAPLSPASYDVSIVDLGHGPQASEVLDTLAGRPIVRIVDTFRPVRNADLVVCGSASTPILGAALEGRARLILFGPAYALLRPEFREVRDLDPTLLEQHWMEWFDCREVSGLSASEMAFKMAAAGAVHTYGGMRAVEAACARKGAHMMLIEARNAGEQLNKAGLQTEASGHGHHDLVDGRGCIRVANAILELVA